MKLIQVPNILVIVALLAVSSVAFPAAVEDEAGLFSLDAVRRAEHVIAQIYQSTEPHKQVLVKTLPSLNEGVSAKDESERLFRDRRLDGVLIFITKDPRRLVTTVGRQTEKRFLSKEQTRSEMLTRFKQNDYDGGLMAGLGVLQRDLVRAFPAFETGKRPVATPSYENAESRSFPWLWILIIGVGLYLLFRMFTRRSSTNLLQSTQNQPMGGSSYNNPVGSPGGGFGRGILGGLLGAIGGNWLYDRFLGNDAFGGSYRNSDDYDRGHEAPPPSDDGDVGSSTQDSWDSGDSASDFGGGDSGDFGGGDSGGGGGDW